MARTLELSDESVQLVVKRGGAEGEPISVDLLEARLLCEELEAKHKLETRDGMMHATREFLRDLAAGLNEMGIDATPSIAAQLWTRLASVIEDLKKNTPSEPSLASSTESTPSS
jgi:hypothetical protein